MRFEVFKKELQPFWVFSVYDIRKMGPSFHAPRLVEWQGKGTLQKIVKGFYRFTDGELSESVLFVIANRIYRPSYISLETALSYYHLIPESVYAITSVNSRDTQKFQTPLAEFRYQKMNRSLMFGYRLVPDRDHAFKIAEVEKAILDYFYLNPHLKRQEDFEGLRLNCDALREQVDEKKLTDYLGLFHNSALQNRVKCFLAFLKHA